MIIHEIQLRVRYAETDKMGYAYYGNYATYFEVARVETFRKLGISYKEMEDEGVMMPVLEYTSKYILPAKYDDLITIKVRIEKKPSIRIVFYYEVYNEEDQLLTKAETTLVFVDMIKNKPTLPPEKFQEATKQYF